MYKALFFFTPLIAAMAGNVGVQSSAIIVQVLPMMWSKVVFSTACSKKLVSDSSTEVHSHYLFLVWSCHATTNRCQFDDRFVDAMCDYCLCTHRYIRAYLIKSKGNRSCNCHWPFITTAMTSLVFSLFLYRQVVIGLIPNINSHACSPSRQ